MTNLQQQMKSALSITARDLIESRISTPELTAPSYALVEDISKGYELKILKEELKAITSLIEDLESFGMKVSEMNRAKAEILTARIAVVKSAIADTKRVNRIIEKAVKAKIESAVEVTEVAVTIVTEEITQVNEVTVIETTPIVEVIEEAPKGITLVARLKCQVTGTVRIETSNEYQNKNQFRKALKSWSDTTIQAISDNRDLEAMEAGFKNFLELKKEAQRFNFQYKEGREYNRILNEVAL